MTHMKWLALLGVVVGCGGDAEPDPAAQIVGTWRELPGIGGTGTVETRPIRMFETDGSYWEDLDGAAGSQPPYGAGTYELGGGLLRYPPYNQDFDLTCDFEVTEDLLLW